MLFGEMLMVGLRAIRANLLRAFLTMLGMIIGVGSVISMIALSAGAQQAIDEQLRSLGTDIISVRPGSRYRAGISERSGVLTTDDAAAILQIGAPVTSVVPQKLTYLPVKYGNVNHNLAVIGTSPNFAEVEGHIVHIGKLFGYADIESKRRVAVVGADVATKFRINPKSFLGDRLYLQGAAFEIVGILEPIGNIGWRNVDEQIWIPLSTAQYRVFGAMDLDMINVKIESEATLEIAMVDIERALRREHKIGPGKTDDFSIGDPAQFLNVRKASNDVFSALLGGVAAVSLLVGGIGIMNIMLVSVTERTREIGLRMALGATRRNILSQFLIEAMVLCIVGGLGGIAIGTIVGKLFTYLFDWQVVISPASIGIAMSFSLSVGLFFGIWPARKAANMEPVDALRWE